MENMWIPRQLCRFGRFAGAASVDIFGLRGPIPSSFAASPDVFHVEHIPSRLVAQINVPRGTFLRSCRAKEAYGAFGGRCV